MSLLPQFNSAAEYTEAFPQDHHWQKAVRYLADKHQLTGSIVRGQLGSHIVFKIGPVWLKMMSPIFPNDMPYEIAGLETAQGKLSIQTPKILFRGELETWPYIIVSNVEGQRIGDVFPKLTAQQQGELAQQMARVTRELNQIEALPAVKARADWNQFIQQRLKIFIDNHRTKKLEGPWLQEMPVFVQQFAEAEFTHDSPVFMHADLTADHFLIKDGKISGIIDFADCRVGHPEYEMVTTITFILKRNREALRKYLEEMNVDVSPGFSKKLMAWVLIHRFSNMHTYFSQDIQHVTEGDFEGLSKLVFPI